MAVSPNKALWRVPFSVLQPRATCKLSLFSRTRNQSLCAVVGSSTARKSPPCSTPRMQTRRSWWLYWRTCMASSLVLRPTKELSSRVRQPEGLEGAIPGLLQLGHVPLCLFVAHGIRPMDAAREGGANWQHHQMRTWSTWVHQEYGRNVITGMSSFTAREFQINAELSQRDSKTYFVSQNHVFSQRCA